MNDGQRNRRAKRSGFTLIELLLVLAILVILGTMAVQVFSGTQEKAEKDAASIQIANFERAIDLYKFHTKKLPGSLDDLMQKPSDATIAERWGGPYIKGSNVPKDPWDSAYKYQANSQGAGGYKLWSLGPDGQDGTDDDITNSAT